MTTRILDKSKQNRKRVISIIAIGIANGCATRCFGSRNEGGDRVPATRATVWSTRLKGLREASVEGAEKWPQGPPDGAGSRYRQRLAAPIAVIGNTRFPKQIGH
ncbi:hypothetical protein [Burkholderia multivorans]|uniref:hypothetical protein n=1 Tax=Burkholderia multivorans TaxID=87883 RepID=UPI0012FE3043|nr:hypothetical protein [Burkholderia multivorans]MBU9307781.1 hypothetical protein [Burkholderia multivorans]MBU9560012.1 hypothetical protein [Burkholderia multivorans]MBU9571726.1 hypothetical protein [Burkholderia multivorans]MBU9616309.1 hypothetical protein [Burkholderia multivorans]MDN7950951.1 hypothetical protein [Burkholderia multivorans]